MSYRAQLKRTTTQRMVLVVVWIVVTALLVILLRDVPSIPIPIAHRVFIPRMHGMLIPDKKNLAVPFTSQAPAGNWAEPWQNACEETDIVMVDNFYRGGSLTQDAAVADIQKILSIKETLFGVSKNESMERVVEIINAAGVPVTVSFRGMIFRQKNLLFRIQAPTRVQILPTITTSS